MVEVAAGGRNSQSALSLDAIAAPEAGLKREPVEERGRPMAVRYGPWVFVGAVTGESPRALARAQRIEAQSESLFARTERLLDAAGARLGDIVKVEGWLTFPMSEYGPLGEVRSRLLARHGLLPASAAVQVRRVAGPDEPLLSFEAIAFAPKGAPRSSHASGAARSLRPAEATPGRGTSMDRPRRSPLAAYYATARRAAGYVFTCGEIPRVRSSARRQADDVYGQLRSYLDEHGAGPSDVVHQTVFLRNESDLPAVKAAERAFRGSRIPTTVLPATDMGFRPGVDVEIELIAETREQGVRREGDAR
jgi:enamine deaminase RidA (YjgF/YER057c/UK114 family)